MLTKSTSSFRVVFAAFVLCFACTNQALTRWSSIHLIPDADFLPPWNVVAEYRGYYFGNETEGSFYKNAGAIRFGISEWVDVQAGYAGGVTLGLKGKILGENSIWLPSLAIGVRNVLHHEEDYFYNHKTALWKNEYFFAFGKSVEALRLRLHFGMETMPDIEAEKLDYFFGIEKYFGGNIYLTLETFYRDKRLRPSLFATARFLGQHAELSIGAVDMTTMFLNDNSEFEVSFVSPPPRGNVRPGIWVGFRINMKTGPLGPYRGFGSVEEQLKMQNGMIRVMRHDIDSCKDALAEYRVTVEKLNKNFKRIADSALEISNDIKLRNTAIEKLTVLATMYGQENFDAAQIKKVMQEIAVYGDVMVPLLQEVVLDNKYERKIHIQAMTVLCTMTSAKAANAILDVMAQTQDPDVKVEGLIAIGSMKDRRAGFLLEQLAGDPNESVAYAANEVLQKLKIQSSRKDSTAATPAAAPVSSIPAKKDTSVATSPSVTKEENLHKGTKPQPPRKPVVAPAARPKKPVWSPVSADSTGKK